MPTPAPPADQRTALSSTTPTAGPTGGVLFVGTPANDNYTGSEFDDTILGGAGDDILHGGAGQDTLSGGLGNDRIDGGAGRDTVRLETALSDYRVTRKGAEIEVVALGGAAVHGTDILAGVERLVFNNTGLAFDADGAAGQVYRLYRAAFDRAPDARGMGFWLANLDQGTTLDALARAFAASQEFQDLYGTVSSNHAIVLKFYQHVLDREPDAAGLAFWRDALDSQRSSVAEVLAAFSESPENQQIVAGLVANGISYEL